MERNKKRNKSPACHAWIGGGDSLEGTGMRPGDNVGSCQVVWQSGRSGVAGVLACDCRDWACGCL